MGAEDKMRWKHGSQGTGEALRAVCREGHDQQTLQPLYALARPPGWTRLGEGQEDKTRQGPAR